MTYASILNRSSRLSMSTCVVQRRKFSINTTTTGTDIAISTSVGGINTNSESVKCKISMLEHFEKKYAIARESEEKVGELDDFVQSTLNTFQELEWFYKRASINFILANYISYPTNILYLRFVFS